jgi:hypothetical protein
MPALNYFFNTTDNLSSVVVNETFTYSHVPATPVFMWQIIAAIAAVFVILSLYIKLRDENGSINPSRVGFSLVGAITCGFAAWLSLAIDLPEGIGSGMVVVDNASTFYSVSQHMIYEGYACVALFVILGLLCFGNMIYTLTVPELLKSDEREFNNWKNKRKSKDNEEEEE